MKLRSMPHIPGKNSWKSLLKLYKESRNIQKINSDCSDLYDYGPRIYDPRTSKAIYFMYYKLLW